jgi:repressor LexA
MTNAGILEGDLVFIDDRQNVKNGDIIIAQWDNEATLKRFRKIDDEIHLIPENDNYSIIKIKNQQDFSIIGKVVGIFRSYN